MSPESKSPLSQAWIGDALWDLFVREWTDIHNVRNLARYFRSRWAMAHIVKTEKIPIHPRINSPAARQLLPHAEIEKVTLNRAEAKVLADSLEIYLYQKYSEADFTAVRELAFNWLNAIWQKAGCDQANLKTFIHDEKWRGGE